MGRCGQFFLNSIRKCYLHGPAQLRDSSPVRVIHIRVRNPIDSLGVFRHASLFNTDCFFFNPRRTLLTTNQTEPAQKKNRRESIRVGSPEPRPTVVRKTEPGELSGSRRESKSRGEPHKDDSTSSAGGSREKRVQLALGNRNSWTPRRARVCPKRPSRGRTPI